MGEREGSTAAKLKSLRNLIRLEPMKRNKDKVIQMGPTKGSSDETRILKGQMIVSLVT